MTDAAAALAREREARAAMGKQLADADTEAAAADKRHQALEHDIEVLQSEAQALRDATANLEKSLAATRKENALAEEEIDALKRQCEEAAGARFKAAEQIADLQRESEQDKVDFEVLQEQLVRGNEDSVRMNARLNELTAERAALEEALAKLKEHGGKDAASVAALTTAKDRALAHIVELQQQVRRRLSYARFFRR